MKEVKLRLESEKLEEKCFDRRFFHTAPILKEVSQVGSQVRPELGEQVLGIYATLRKDGVGKVIMKGCLEELTFETRS